MLNHIVVMGRLTHNPELRSTQSGVNVCSFSIACDRDFKSKDSKEKETDFIDCVAWRSTAEFVTRYFAKGRMAVVSGRLQLRDWKDKDGNNRRSAEIVADNVYFGDSKNKGQEPQEVSHEASDGFPTGTGLPKGFVPDFGNADDYNDLPF